VQSIAGYPLVNVTASATAAGAVRCGAGVR
jgi:hypothetical protein